MSPDQGLGIPGWFIALFILIAVLAVGTGIWRIMVARKIAEDAGLDPNKAAAVTMLSNDGVGAAYLASTLAARSPLQSPPPSTGVKTAEERLQETRVS